VDKGKNGRNGNCRIAFGEHWSGLTAESVSATPLRAALGRDCLTRSRVPSVARRRAVYTLGFSSFDARKILQSVRCRSFDA
jgi:hypothetical protein